MDPLALANPLPSWSALFEHLVGVVTTLLTFGLVYWTVDTFVARDEGDSPFDRENVGILLVLYIFTYLVVAYAVDGVIDLLW